VDEWAQLRTRGAGAYFALQARMIRARFSRKYPTALQIEPYGGCNIRCAMCFQGRMPLPADQQMMSIDLYRKVIDEVSPVTPMLYLYWRGEPLLHPQIAEMVRYAKTKAMYVFISTAATTLTEALAGDLVDAGLDFALIGMDGATRETYESMRRGAKFEQVTENVRRLIRLRSERAKRIPHVSLQFIVSSLNQGDLPLMKQLTRDLGADSYTEKTLDLYVNFTSVQVQKALVPLFVGGTFSKYQKKETGHEYARRGPCAMATRMVVRADGRMSLCCYDMQERFAIGNATDDHLLKLWAAPAYTSLRRQGVQRKTSLCVNCGAGIQK
jgi:radical SAM protein with 4Fe4S-binding SPASM domain